MIPLICRLVKHIFVFFAISRGFGGFSHIGALFPVFSGILH